ncbi:MAG TPA: hypothetical protein VIM07_15095 [Chitinophagaceae bacterium]
MNSSDILFVSVIIIVIASLINFIVISGIIKSATRSKQISQSLLDQNLLLGKIAQRQGVTDDEINSILFKEEKKSKSKRR